MFGGVDAHKDVRVRGVRQSAPEALLVGCGRFKPVPDVVGPVHPMDWIANQDS